MRKGTKTCINGYTDIRLDVDGNVNIPGIRPRAGAHVRIRERDGLLCTWREACKDVVYDCLNTRFPRHFAACHRALALYHKSQRLTCVW